MKTTNLNKWLHLDSDSKDVRIEQLMRATESLTDFMDADKDGRLTIRMYQVDGRRRMEVAVRHGDVFYYYEIPRKTDAGP